MTLKANFIAASGYLNLAETDRSILQAQSRNTAGVIFSSGTSMAGISDLQVTPDTGHTIRVSIGRAIIREKTNPALRGSYLFHADAMEIVSLPTVDTNPFIATVVARVADPQYGSVTGSVGPRIDVIKGTPASSPSAVSDATIDAVSGTPGGWIRLADVRINTTDTGAIPAGQFTDTRKPGGFGRINALSTNRPTILSPGLEIHQLDDKANGTYDGANWRIFDTQWIETNPAFSTSGNPAVMAIANRKARTMRRGLEVVTEMTFKWTALGGGEGLGDGFYLFNVPYPIASFYVVDEPLGPAAVLDAGLALYNGQACMWDTNRVYINGNSGKVTHNTPLNPPTNNDSYFLNLRYYTN